MISYGLFIFSQFIANAEEATIKKKSQDKGEKKILGLKLPHTDEGNQLKSQSSSKPTNSRPKHSKDVPIAPKVLIKGSNYHTDKLLVQIPTGAEIADTSRDQPFNSFFVTDAQTAKS